MEASRGLIGRNVLFFFLLCIEQLHTLPFQSYQGTKKERDIGIGRALASADASLNQSGEMRVTGEEFSGEKMEEGAGTPLQLIAIDPGSFEKEGCAHRAPAGLDFIDLHGPLN